MNRIHWTPEESLAVATRVFEQLRPSKLEDLRGAQILAAVRAAQSELLPDVRQRVFTSMFNVASLMPYLKSVFINGKAQDEEKEQMAEPKAQDEEKEQMAEPKAQELTPVELALADRIVQRLLDPDSTLADRLAEKILESLAAAFSRKNEETPQYHHPVLQPQHNPIPVEVKRKVRMVIGVLGLKPNQEQVLKNQFKHVAFKFYKNFPNGKAPFVHYMIGMVGFVHHDDDGKAYRKYGKNYYRNSNGMTSLAEKVKTLQSKFDEEIERGILPVTK